MRIDYGNYIIGETPGIMPDYKNSLMVIIRLDIEKLEQTLVEQNRNTLEGVWYLRELELASLFLRTTGSTRQLECIASLELAADEKNRWTTTIHCYSWAYSRGEKQPDG